MAKVLFAWELGAGLGHIMQFAPLANGLAALGHRVFAALRELRSAVGTLDPAVQLLAAPFRNGLPPTPRATRNFADLLQDVTFESERMLGGHVAAWRTIYGLVKPDLIVFDHSPTALLAARGMNVRKLVIGVGFLVPPDLCPFPALTPRAQTVGDDIAATEEQVLERANRVLASHG